MGLDVRFWFQAMTFMLDFAGLFPRIQLPTDIPSHRVHSSAASGRSPRPGESFKKDLGHHPFVLMLQEVTVEYRDAANDRVRELHDEIE